MGSSDASARSHRSVAPPAEADRSQSPPENAPLPQPRPPGAGPSSGPAPEPVSPPSQPSTTPEPAASAPATDVCRRRLAELGAIFEPVEPPKAAAPCGIADPVRLEALVDRGRRIALPDRPVLACSFALVVAGYARDVLAPLARGQAGGEGVTGEAASTAELAAFGTGPGYTCRTRNHVAGARPSAHGRGEAIDIGWFSFAGGRRIVVGDAASGEAAIRFVGAVRRSACGWFTTVLGPGTDAAHADHLHFDIERRGRSGDHRLCQ